MEGWVNCDLYNPAAEVKCDVRKLPFEDGEADEIYSSHLIEHFDFREAFDVLKEWQRVLKPEGILIIETPDFEASCKKFLEIGEQKRVEMYSHFFAKPWVDGETHKFLYTEGQLRWTLGQLGFKDIVRQPALRYIGREDICLKLLCRK